MAGPEMHTVAIYLARRGCTSLSENFRAHSRNETCECSAYIIGAMEPDDSHPPVTAD